jgi:hypothetical protein
MQNVMLKGDKAERIFAYSFFCKYLNISLSGTVICKLNNFASCLAYHYKIPR